MTGKELQRLQGEYWISVLEEFGILPNYTLLDDMVVLDVAVTWIDPETQEFRSEPASFLRSSANALREFAPGATFYARGLEILIDAVDLGPDDSAIRSMAFCPSCGFAIDLSAPGPGAAAPALCPRCGGPGLSGTEHRLDVVELSRVSAQLRRDEAAINDRNDERKRERYAIAVAADIDPAYVARQWYVNGYDFGTKYLRRMVIRWVNLGRSGVHGASRQIAGSEGPAPLFRVCEGCGVLDRNSGANRPEEHRAWCRYRKASDEHVRNIALTRTLTTQGAVIRLPQIGHAWRPVRDPEPRRGAAARPAGADRRQPRPHRHRGDQRARRRPRRCDQRGAAAARRRARRHRLPGRARGPGADVGSAVPGLGTGPRLPLPAGPAAGLPSVPHPVRRGRQPQQRVPLGRGAAPAGDPHLRHAGRRAGRRR